MCTNHKIHAKLDFSRSQNILQEEGLEDLGSKLAWILLACYVVYILILPVFVVVVKTTRMKYGDSQGWSDLWIA